jgi:anti-sigma regulatory factor (Ser/Thr protein kinase)
MQEERFAVGDLAWLRTQVLSSALALGLPPERADRFAVSVHEAMMNAVLHGGSRRWVRVSDVDGGALRAEVFDDGVAGAIAIPGRAPSPDQVSGRGLWIASQFCDRVDVRTGATGTSVRLEMDRQG